MTTLDCGVSNAVLNGFSCKAGDADTGSDSESMVESDPVELLLVVHCIGLCSKLEASSGVDEEAIVQEINKMGRDVKRG